MYSRGLQEMASQKIFSTPNNVDFNGISGEG